MVVLPEAWPGVLTAGTLAWARALGEFGPLLIFAGTTRNKTEVLSTTVYLELSVGDLAAAVTVWSTAWTSAEDARDFAYSYRRLLATRFPGALPDDVNDDDLRVVHDGRVWTVRRDDDIVRVMVGPATRESAPKTSP